MKRRLTNLLTNLSLLMCVAVCALWVRSYWRVDLLTFDFSPLRVSGVYSGQGSLCVELYGSPDSDGEWGQFQVPGHFASHEATGDPLAWEQGDRVALVLKYGEAAPFTDRANGVFPFVVIPYWLLVLLLSAWPACVLAARRRRRRLKIKGLCPDCGYDLRASPGRCPECGYTPAGAES